MSEYDFSTWQKFPALESSYEKIRDFILDAAKIAGVHDQCLLKLELGIEELVINVIHYAYEDGGNIFIKTRVEDNFFIFEIADFGVPFNPLEKIDPRSIDTSKIENRKIGGFGIAFAKKIFEDLRYEFKNFGAQNANLLFLKFKIY